MGYTLPDPKAAKKKSSKPADKAGQSANQGTATQGWDSTGASTVSYITSFLPGSDKPTTRTEAQLNKQLYDMTPAERISYATKLKAAGYKVGPVNGAVTKSLRQAWLSAHSDLQTEIQAGQALDLATFLTANAGTGTGTGGPKTNIATYQINDTAASALITNLFRTLADKDPTPAEISKYTNELRKAQAANPSKVVYDSNGNSRTTGGIDTTQFLTQKLEATPEAKTNRATDAYSVMMEELGGLR